MQLVPTRRALQLTGLSAPTLREWTIRRALIPADVPAKSQGSSAQYGWQTILQLRLAVTLRDRFHLELQAHRPFFASLRRGLLSKSFIALWNKGLALHGCSEWLLVDEAAAEPLRQDAVILLLNPHLVVISEGFALPRLAAAEGQLDLFPAIGEPARRSGSRSHGLAAERRRRSA